MLYYKRDDLSFAFFVLFFELFYLAQSFVQLLSVKGNGEVEGG